MFAPLSALPELGPKDAHVWIFSTDASMDECAEFRELLSPEEKARADRFVFDSDRVRFTASHGLLRVQLGAYCGRRPEDLVFGVGSHGKPLLIEPAAPVQFNLSHSGSRAALVVTANIRCGVDIEKLRAEVSDRAVAERFFCRRENEWLQSLPATQRTRGFFRLWAVKEAILKADGKGMSIPLASVDTTNVLNGVSSSVSLPDGDGRVLSLWVGELNVADGYASALAVEGVLPGVHILQAKNLLVDP